MFIRPVNPMNMPHTSQPYYPPNAYRPVPTANKPQYPMGYPDPSQGFPPPHPNMYPPSSQHPGMWPPNSQPGVPQPRFLNPHTPQMPGKPQQQEFRRPQPPSTSAAPPPPQPQQYYMQNNQQGMASPSSAQRQQRVPPQVQQMPPATTASQQYQPHPMSRQMQPQQGQMNASFPPGCLEAIATATAMRRKRPRSFARDINGATPKRLTMALRSGQELDTIWAINVLTVILYDDMAQPLILSSEPQLLGLCIEHFKALLAVLYPQEFSLTDNAKDLEVFEDFVENAPNSRKNSVVEMGKINGKVEKKSRKNSTDFTFVSRTGRKVYVEKEAKKPMILDRLCKEWEDEQETSKENKALEEGKFVSGLCHRIYKGIMTRLQCKRGLKRMRFSKHDVIKEEVQDGEEEDVKEEMEEETLFYRQPKPNETWNREITADLSLIPRAAPLVNRDVCLEEIGDRLLAMSNIIRGFSFFPGNEKLMYNNTELLDLIGRLLMLKVKRDEQRNLESAKLKAEKEAEEKVKKEVEEDEKGDKKEPEKKSAPSEEDSDEKLLLEIANQLRDDAFTLLSHISVQLDLYNQNSDVTYRLMDALLHWAVTTNIQAKDPINNAVYSPKLYVFEVICKMSLLESNIDLLLSTGPWPRIEEFVRVVANSVTMSEELPLREFAIVILTAICQASEPACVVATLETDVIQNLVSFLEAAEFNITTIATTEGVTVLRDNPERMGTSFGMLRRAAQILACLAQYEVCRPYFVKHQSRLLSFTVSSYMDSRVAGMVAGILYDLQHIPSDLLLAKEVSPQETSKMAERFPSFKWKVSDDAEDPPEPFLNVTLPPPTNPFHVEAQKGLPKVSISPDSRSMSPSKTNGNLEVNGNTKHRRKRSRHSDGREMTALESALLNDSDAESGPESDGETSQPASDTNSLNSQPNFKSASDAVKEKLRNNINMKHGLTENGHEEEPDQKRQRIGNGMSAVSPKCNGDLNNKVRPNKSENGNGTPTKQSGSMAAVA
uniref:BAF250_C domain-containing protein n=1 Tax=Bursaphelenchus xylophilus TaxID=6326 RepID=A0A1I7S0W0_BURXY